MAKRGIVIARMQPLNEEPALTRLSPEKMVIADFEGKTVKGKLRPSSDTLTHAVLYKHWENIGGIAHTHSTYATAWAQSQRDIPIFGTTHADHNTVDIPCAPPMNDEMIRVVIYVNHQTGFQIMNVFRDKNLDYKEVEMVLVGNHAPFTWGKSADKTVYNSAVLESIAQMAYLTHADRCRRPQGSRTALINKHFINAKHGLTPCTANDQRHPGKSHHPKKNHQQKIIPSL